MSDFDKEKEREKLREKYERDQEKREVAEKMSELLLQGATMTNAHCSQCGDPIFRYDGQEFCATCEKPVDREEDDDASAADDAGERDGREDATDDSETIEVTSPSDDARVQFGSGDGTDADADADADADSPTEADGTAAGHSETPADAPRSPEIDAGQPPSTGRETAPEPDRQPRGETPTRPRRPAREGDVSAARESLVRTLTRFSEAAEQCEDPQRAREYLAAAREAAETLATLRR